MSAAPGTRGHDARVLENFTQLTVDEQHLVETFAPMSFIDPTPQPQRRAEYVATDLMPTWTEELHKREQANRRLLETDPTGRDQHAPGAKVDAGKLRAGLVLGSFPRALRAVAEVGTFGAKKYSDNGWKQVPNGVARYTDAMWRHYLAHAAGEPDDTDSGFSHLAHMAWNALAILELTLSEAVPAYIDEIEDRLRRA